MQSKSPVMFLLASGGFYWFFVMVPVAGVEPARPKALDFESIIFDVNICIYLVFYEQYVCNACAIAINLGYL